MLVDNRGKVLETKKSQIYVETDLRQTRGDNSSENQPGYLPEACDRLMRPSGFLTGTSSKNNWNFSSSGDS